MADPLSITASVTRITILALNGTKLLLDDLQVIKDAPETIKRLEDDVRSVDMALTSLRTLEDQDWELLGASIAEKSKTTISTCTRACDLFRADIQRWTRHSGGRKLMWQDRANVDFFKQWRIKAKSEQLHNYGLTINSILSMATLYSSIRHTLYTKQIEIKRAIGAADEQLAVLENRLEELNLTTDDQEVAESMESKAEVLLQLEEERKELSASRKLLDELLSRSQVKAVLPPERPETPPKPSSTVPFRRDPDFVEREAMLDQIHQKCATPGSWTALVGLGGVGKSQLAIEYAYRTRELSPETWVFWVHASNAGRFEQSYRDIADRVKLSGRRNPKANIFKLVYDWLCDENKGKWVLILDNVDDARFLVDARLNSQGQPHDSDWASKPLREYLPQSRNGSNLMTTRSREAALMLVEPTNIIAVEPMDETHALALFEKKLAIQDNSNDIAELAAALEFIPLAIIQAAAYVSQRAPRCSVRQYLEEFRKSDRKRTSLLNYEGGQLRRDREAKNSIIITWQISFDHIHQTRPSATDLLSLMSFFDRQGIPEALLRNRAEQGNGQYNWEKRNSDDGDHDKDNTSQLSESDEFEDDVLALRNYSFISLNADGKTFKMHRLVQLAMRKWLEVNSQLERWKQQFVRNLCTEFPTGEPENWARCQTLFPHVKAAAIQQPEEQGSLIDWASILYKASWYAWRMGDGAEAEEMSVKAMKVMKMILGREHEDTLSSMGMVGLAYSSNGRWNEAEELEVQVMETRKMVLGAEHPDTLTSIGNLASTYGYQGRWDQAEELFVQVMETSEKVLGAEHPDTLTSMANLASTYGNQGRWDQAEELFVQVMETRKRVLGMEHPDTLTSIGNLASTYGNQGRWDQAEELFVQVIETSKRVLGVGHQDTLTSMANLALMYGNQGRWDQAEELFVQVMETRKRVFGAEHSDTLTSMANLASTYRNQGRWDQAEELFVQVIETSKRVLGVDHPDTLTCISNLAFMRKERGRSLETATSDVEADTKSSTRGGLTKAQMSLEQSKPGLSSLSFTDIPKLSIPILVLPKKSIPELSQARISNQVIKLANESRNTNKWQVSTLSLDAVAKRRKLVSSPGEPELSLWELEVFWDLSHCIHEELNGKAELENVLTLSGNSTQAAALPCIEYVDQTWGTIGKQIIRLIEDALTVQRLPSSPDRITRKLLGGMELTVRAAHLVEEKTGFPSKITIHGSPEDCETAYQVITWVTATFRRPEAEKLCSSHAMVQMPSNDSIRRVRIKPSSLTEVDKDGMGACWQPLFPSTVIATDFPLPNQKPFIGLQIPFDVMLDLSGILHGVDLAAIHQNQKGVYFKGVHSLLFPTKYSKETNAVQWHLIWNEEKSLPAGLINKYADRWDTSLDLDTLKGATAFLGYCAKIGITLGTQDRLAQYDQMAVARADRDRPAPEVSVNTTTGGISAHGFISAQMAVGAKYRKGLVVTRGHKMRYMDLLDAAAKKPVILFDTAPHNERAWLVPQLSIILDLVNYWSYKNNVNDLRFADLTALGGYAAKTVLKDPLYANKVLRKAILDDEKDERVADKVEDLYIQMSYLAEADATSERHAMGTKELSLERLLGWDLLGLCNPDMLSYQRSVDLRSTDLDKDLWVSPCWLPLTREVLVLLGRNLGELIVPMEPANLCRNWSPLPGGFHFNYLAASIACLLEISKDHGHDDCCLVLDDLVWRYEHEGVFNDCDDHCLVRGKACSKKPQLLYKSADIHWRGRREVSPGYYRPRINVEGVIAFTNLSTLMNKVLKVKGKVKDLVGEQTCRE